MGWIRWGGCRSALGALLLLGACAPTLRVARPAPAVVDLGPKARVLSLVRVDGPGDAPEVVVHTLKGRAARQGWFQVEAWKAGEPVDASGRRAYVMALFFFLAAMLSKTTAFSLPPLLLLLCWWKRGRIREAGW